MANKKFSQFTAQAPSASTSYLVGYDSTANDNIRFQEGDLNLADMGGAIDLATQTTGDINLTTQVTGVLPLVNGGTGVTQLSDAQQIGRKSVASTWWTTTFLNVPRGGEYTLPFNANQTIIRNTSFTYVGYAAFAGLPAGVTQLGAINKGFQMTGLASLKMLVKVTLRMSFYDQTAELNIQGGFYFSTNGVTWAGATKYLLIRDKADEASDAKIYEASAFVEIPSGGGNYYFLPWVRFDNGSADPFPYYDASMVGAANQFTLEIIY